MLKFWTLKSCRIVEDRECVNLYKFKVFVMNVV